MARIDVVMPQMGESIAEGTLSRWLKKAGDPVKRDEPIFEISTDKVDAEIPAPGAGVLTEILVQEGETVAVQTVVGRIETEASTGAPAPAAAPVAAPPAPPAPAAPSPPRAPAPTAARREPAPAAARSEPAPAPPAQAQPSAPVGNGAVETAEERLQRKSTPLVRKMAAEHNIDLSAIPGTGISGRVTKHDVLNYLEAPPAPSVQPPSTPAAARGPAAAAAPASPRPPQAAQSPGRGIGSSTGPGSASSPRTTW